MTPVAWTKGALRDLEEILTYAAERSPQGAATIAARVRDTELTISTFPRASRLDAETGAYEAVVGGVPLLVIYELITVAAGTLQVDIIAVFHTSRDPDTKPGRRE
jgi:plasmid stabilization system protein ParE